MIEGPWGRRLTPGQWFFEAARKMALAVGREVAHTAVVVFVLIVALAAYVLMGLYIPLF